MENKTVFIAEDEPLAREVLRDAIYGHAGLRLVGEAADGATALAQIDRLRPDVVFMDIQMPEMTGLEVLKRLACAPQIVFTTAHDQYAVTAFELNAVDYLLKPFTRARFDAAVARLLEPAIYEADKKDELKNLVADQAFCVRDLGTLENEWLELQEQLEGLAA